MRKTLIAMLGAFALMILFLGHASSATLLSSSEDKINAAFPLSAEVETHKTSLLKLANSAQKKAIETQFDAHLKQRARHCIKDDSTSLLTSIEEIREHLKDPSCFAEADKAIVAWLGLRKAGLMLAQPPLTPIPAEIPSAILSDSNIQTARFADKSGVMLLITEQTIELVDSGTMGRLFCEQSRQTQPGPLSHNGRLFIMNDNGQLRIRDAQTGATIAEIPSVWHWEFHWLDERTAFYVNQNYQSFFIDFASGETISTGITTLVTAQAVLIPNVPDQYAILTGNKLLKFELVRNTLLPELTLLTEKPVSLPGLASNTSGTTSNGNYFFNTGSHLTLINLSSLESEEISLEPFFFQTGIAAPAPDNIIVTGFIQPQDGSIPQDYLYSISNRSLAQIKSDKPGSSLRRIYIRPFRKLGIIYGNKIALMAPPQTAENIPLADFLKQVIGKSEQNKITNAERRQALKNSCHPSKEKNKGGVELHAVGIYEGPLGRSESAKNKVDITVYKSEQPIALALFSYEPVTWKISMGKGALLKEVILKSSDGILLRGINRRSIKITRQKFGYTAYEDCNFFRMIAPKLKELSGLNVTSFQGAYRGIGFFIHP